MRPQDIQRVQLSKLASNDPNTEATRPSSALSSTRAATLARLGAVIVASSFAVGCPGRSTCEELSSCPDDAAAPSAFDAGAEPEQALVPPPSADAAEPDESKPPRDNEVPIESTTPEPAPVLLDASADPVETDDDEITEASESDSDGAGDAGYAESFIDAGVGNVDDAGSADGGQSDACADDDCIDEDPTCFDLGNCECQPFEERSCEAAGYLGACALGIETCTEEGSFGECSVLPLATDSCFPGADDNCDGVANSPLDPTCECLVGQSECLAGMPSTARRTCNAEGSWDVAETCPFVCTGEGVCGGVCTPGTRLCDGNDVSECNLEGQWQEQGPCPVTTPCQGNGLCLECPDGSYASGGTCVPWSDCAPGEFVAAPGTSTADTVCSVFPEGSLSTEVNAASCTPWTDCAPGQFVTQSGTATTDRECAPCGIGTYSGSANSTACTTCGAGTFNTAPGSSSCSNWTTCAAGQYVSGAGSALNDRTCSVCTTGTFSTGTNANSCNPFTRCDDGYTEATAGTASRDRTCKLIPSCVGMTTQCGDPEESCCTSLLVTGGSFELMSLDEPAALSTFQLDKFEVTLGRFRKFVDAWDDGYRPADGAGKHTHLNGGSGLSINGSTTVYETGWDTDWEDFVSSADSVRGPNDKWSTWTLNNELKPVNYVNWYEAYAFCIWDGGFLPSSNEHYFAGVGGGSRVYPWSSPSSSTAISSENASYACTGDGKSECSYTDIQEVGLFPAGAGRYGQLDLAGNIEEWVLDPATNGCTNCSSTSTSSSRAVRGGTYEDPSASLLNEANRSASQATRRPETGFRCARTY